MTINIDLLTEAELVDLNHRIVERLRFLQHMRAHAAMLDFRIGEQVTFQPAGEKEVEGILTRYNKKTVTIIGSDGRHWNVSPQLIQKKQTTTARRPHSATVVPLLKR